MWDLGIHKDCNRLSDLCVPFILLVSSYRHSEELAEAGEAVIAVSEECCWCCDWLSKNLESQFTLPGTHGMIYPWDPPKFGVSELVLKKLEGELWNQLCVVVMASLALSIEPPKLFLTDESMPQLIRSLLSK